MLIEIRVAPTHATGEVAEQIRKSFPFEGADLFVNFSPSRKLVFIDVACIRPAQDQWLQAAQRSGSILFWEPVGEIPESNTVTQWATILDALEAGIRGDKVKCRAYAELWLEKLQADGETRIASSLQHILEGKRSKVVYFAQTNVPAEQEVTRQVTIDTLTVTVTYPGWWEERHLEEWLLLIVQGACVIEVGERVTLRENDVPDLAYDAGGHAPTSVAELMKMQECMSREMK